MNRLDDVFRLSRTWCRTHLEHGEQQVLFSALVLISVNGEHDCLQQLIDLGQCHQATQVGNVFRLRLK